MGDEEILLDGGNVSTVVRVGDTVRRSTGSWTPAVHELLQHLETVGFPYSPRVLGVDERGREILTFIEGETVGSRHPWPPWAWADDTVVQVGKIVRDYHEAVVDFRPAGPRPWRFVTDNVEPDEVVCHNDIAPYNIVYRDGHVVGLIDWDLASPAAPSWDVAFAAWTFAPIHASHHARRLAAPTNVARRIRLLCDSYGLTDRENLLETIRARIQASITGIEERAQAGEAAFQRLLAEGHVTRMHEDLATLDADGAEWLATMNAAN